MGPEMTLVLSQRLHLQACHSLDGSSVLLKTATAMADVK